MVLAVAAGPAAAQQGTVSATVTDVGTGEALPGVQVFVQGMSIGSLTDHRWVGSRFPYPRAPTRSWWR